MSSQQLDEEAIFEVAREIRNPDIRAKYLSHVCPDHELRSRLAQKCNGHRRWQFGIRTLLAVMVVAALLSAGLAVSLHRAAQAQRMAEQAQRQAIQAAEQAAANFQLAKQQLNLLDEARAAERQSRDTSSEETSP